MTPAERPPKVAPRHHHVGTLVGGKYRIKRLLGTEGNIGEGMGLTNDFMVRVIRHIGNYGEVYERHVGANTPVGIPREESLNALWTKGGLMYAMPFR